MGVVAIGATLTRPVADEQEIYSFTFKLKFDSTVGTCTGCTDRACLNLTMIRVTQVGAPFFELTQPSDGAISNFVTWQGGDYAKIRCYPDPTINKTWGSVKALYR